MGSTQQTTLARGRHFFSWWKVAIPIAIGLGVVVLMMVHESKERHLGEVFSSITFDWRTVVCIVFGFLFIFGRDFGLSWRFRTLTDKQLSWKEAYRVDLLCEFTSCVTPSAVGGSSLGMVFLNSEGIEFGRATTLMMTTLFLDELFFVLFCPIVILVTPNSEIFSATHIGFAHGIKFTFFAVYAILALWTFILFTGIIWKPFWIRKVINRIFKWRILKRWSASATNLADNMVATSKALKQKPFRFWLEVFGGTALSWASRFMVVNALFFGFVASSDPMQWVIFAREFVIWVVLMLCPTPGGAGLSEWIFSEFYSDMVTTAGLALLLAVLWRLITYYLYLAIGAFIVPGWLHQTYDRVHTDVEADRAKDKKGAPDNKVESDTGTETKKTE